MQGRRPCRAAVRAPRPASGLLLLPLAAQSTAAHWQYSHHLGSTSAPLRPKCCSLPTPATTAAAPAPAATTSALMWMACYCTTTMKPRGFCRRRGCGGRASRSRCVPPHCRGARGGLLTQQARKRVHLKRSCTMRMAPQGGGAAHNPRSCLLTSSLPLSSLHMACTGGARGGAPRGGLAVAADGGAALPARPLVGAVSVVWSTCCCSWG